MLKRYAPYILLLLAALAMYFITTHQRGPATKGIVDVNTGTVTANEAFSRTPDSIIYTKHARCRMDCRHITEEEVKQVIQSGEVNARKIEEDDKGKTYPLEGRTQTDKMLRVVVAPKKNNLVVVTVIDLDTEWPCSDCK